MGNEIEANAEQIALWGKGYERYETVRKMTPREFHDLYLRNLSGEASFDKLVDSIKASK